jgi:hypothetical protein
VSSTVNCLSLLYLICWPFSTIIFSYPSMRLQMTYLYQLLYMFLHPFQLNNSSNLVKTLLWGMCVWHGNQYAQFFPFTHGWSSSMYIPWMSFFYIWKWHKLEIEKLMQNTLGYHLITMEVGNLYVDLGGFFYIFNNNGGKVCKKIEIVISSYSY